MLKPNGTIDSSGDFIDNLGVVYNSNTKADKIREISSARGASMLVRKDIFEELDGFDEKFFVSFEDVDIGWRAWILGYHVVMIPTSIVYHIGGVTTEKMKSHMAFHGLKNQLSMKITNFERRFVMKSMFLFFIIYGFRELKIFLDYTIKGSTHLTPTKYEDKIAAKPNVRSIFKALFWILTNYRYLIKKHKKVNSNRINGTKELEQRGIIIHN